MSPGSCTDNSQSFSIEQSHETQFSTRYSTDTREILAAVMRGEMLRRLEQETEKSPGAHISLALSNKLKRLSIWGKGNMLERDSLCGTGMQSLVKGENGSEMLIKIL